MMTEEQKKIVATIEKIADMLNSGKMPLEMCPIADLRTAFYCALCYQENISLAEQIAEKYCNMLEMMIAKDERQECYQMLDIMAKFMICEFEKRNYYEKQNKLLTDELENLKKGNIVYDDIVQSYKEKKIDERFLEEHTYQALVSVKEKGEIELFKEISNCVYKTILERIRKKQKKKIAFFLKDSAEWSCEELYKKFSGIPEYEISIVVVPFFVGTQQTISQTYVNTIQYFKERNFDTVGLYDVYQNRFRSWKEIGMPDIVFHLNPHYTAFRESSNICNFPLSILNIYIPYGVMIYGNVEHQFNQMSHMLYWKIFCETPLHKEMAAKYSDIGDSNVISSGYVKMDSLLEEQLQVERKIWKISPKADAEKVKKIIYAPHWSVKDSFTGFGNFEKIYMQLYEYVKSNETTTSWVFRPHPMLRAGVVQQGIFKTEGEYDKYLAMWNQLPNAQVMEEGMYIDIFETSDAMILDSVSFLAEYLYMHKPMLFLTRERNTFNDFGKELVKVLYKIDGGDFEGIERFVKEVVIAGEDPMRMKREEFFEKYMNYEEQNGMSASEYIYRYIEQQIH